MNISLRQRVTSSFIVSNVVVLLISFLVFQYLSSLNKEIEEITITSNKISLLTDEIRITTVAILKDQRKLLMGEGKKEDVNRLVKLCDSLTTHLQNLNSLYTNPDGKEVVAKMISYVDSLKVVLSKATLFNRGQTGLESIEDLMDKILETFSDFQDIQYFESEQRNEQMKMILKRTKQKMMITLIIGFLGTIILGLVVPGKIALPFKKIKDAIRELQECNFDVSIYYNQDDEIGEIAREMNKMIHSLKVFEELRTDRVAVEGRKFDALANMVRRPVLVANASGKLIYLNNQLYDILQVQSEEVIGKDVSETVIPKSIIEAYELAIKRRSKIENAEIVIKRRKAEGATTSTEEDEEAQEAEEGSVKKDVDQQMAEDDLTKEEEKKVIGEKIAESREQRDSKVSVGPKEKPKQVKPEDKEVAYRGYATVIPIRGKESSLDYYLMVLSKEVIA